MPASPQAPDRSMEHVKDHVGMPIADILANISQEGANRVFVDYLQRTTPESQYLVGDAHTYVPSSSSQVVGDGVATT